MVETRFALDYSHYHLNHFSRLQLSWGFLMAYRRYFWWFKFLSESFARFQRGGRRQSPSDVLRFRPGELIELESRYVAGNLLNAFGWEFLGIPPTDTYVTAGFPFEEPRCEARQSSVITDEALTSFSIVIDLSAVKSQSEEKRADDGARAEQAPTDMLESSADLAAPDWFADFIDPLGPSSFPNTRAGLSPTGGVFDGVSLPASPHEPQVGGAPGINGGPGFTGGGGDAPTSAAPPSADFGPPSMLGAPGNDASAKSDSDSLGSPEADSGASLSPGGESVGTGSVGRSKNAAVGHSENTSLHPKSGPAPAPNAPGVFATVADFVWDDLNRDGIQDPEEPGIADVLVKLNADGIALDSTITDADGFYQFVTGPGTYSLTFYLPEAYVFSPPNQGSDELDSDVETELVGYGYTGLFTLGVEENLDTVDAGMQEVQVVSVIYFPTGQGTTGDLSADNPNGEMGTPTFGGGYRFFPDAGSYATRTVSRNIVRLRATIIPARAGIPIHFRSFDVDDPSTIGIIDPFGADGSDNRGTLAGANLDAPGLLAQNGYRGHLRPVGGAFAAEGGIVTVPSTLGPLGNASADVELATSFNPGDNFRVAASTIQAQLTGLNDTTSVPTTGAIANFEGAVSDQLSVWRSFHIEQDRMTALSTQGPVTAMVTAVAGAGFEWELTTNLNIPLPNQFNGGSVYLRRTIAGQPFVFKYRVVSHSWGDNAHITIFLDLPGSLVPQVNEQISIFQGDFQTGNTTAIGAVQNGTVMITTDQWFERANEYQGGIFRIGGTNYPIVSNTSNGLGTPNDTVTITANAAPNPGAFSIYQDDYGAQGNEAPVRKVDVNDDSNLYDMLQASTRRDLNRYADAYLEPERNALSGFNSNNVTPVSHLPATVSDIQSWANPFRGTSPGTQARPADYETDVFWVVYVATAYEPRSHHAGDAGLGWALGITDGDPGQFKQISVVYLETIRDAFYEAQPVPGLTLPELLARVAAHEIGHQFQIASTPDEHRDGTLMDGNAASVAGASFYLDFADIIALRNRISSPGS